MATTGAPFINTRCIGKPHSQPRGWPAHGLCYRMGNRGRGAACGQVGCFAHTKFVCVPNVQGRCPVANLGKGAKAAYETFSPEPWSCSRLQRKARAVRTTCAEAHTGCTDEVELGPRHVVMFARPACCCMCRCTLRVFAPGCAAQYTQHGWSSHIWGSCQTTHPIPDNNNADVFRHATDGLIDPANHPMYPSRCFPPHEKTKSKGWPSSLLEPSEWAFELTHGSACIIGWKAGLLDISISPYIAQFMECVISRIHYNFKVVSSFIHFTSSH